MRKMLAVVSTVVMLLCCTIPAMADSSSLTGTWVSCSGQSMMVILTLDENMTGKFTVLYSFADASKLSAAVIDASWSANGNNVTVKTGSGKLDVGDGMILTINPSTMELIYENGFLYNNTKNQKFVKVS